MKPRFFFPKTSMKFNNKVQKTSCGFGATRGLLRRVRIQSRKKIPNNQKKALIFIEGGVV